MSAKILIISLISLLFLFSCRPENAAPDKGSEACSDTIQYVYRYGIRTDSLEVTEHQIRPGDNPASIFASLGVPAARADSINRCSSSILDPTKLRAGMHYYTFTAADSTAALQYLVFAKSLTEFAVIDLAADTIRAYPYNKEITLKKKFVSGTITSSLWNAIAAGGADPLLAIKLADVFAWQIDFFDVKEGDSFRALYQEAYIDDTIPLAVASIEGAEFIHQGKPYRAVPFMQDSVNEYFDDAGNSVRKAFLKAPLDFFRISSRFSNSRFHPVLKRYRAHHGVDYAAPTGTPVKSIGAGVVVKKAYQANGGGNYLTVKHNSVYTTTYMHLSRFAAGMAPGKHVQQGEVIGYVGATGLATGPHLDFRVFKNGTPINPLSMEAPPSLPVKPELRDSFLLVSRQVFAELDSCTQYKKNIAAIPAAPGDSSAVAQPDAAPRIATAGNDSPHRSDAVHPGHRNTVVRPNRINSGAKGPVQADRSAVRN